MLAAQEQRFPGITEEVLQRERDEGIEADEQDELEQHPCSHARVVLRRSEMKPRLFDYQQDLVRQMLAVVQAPAPKNVALLSLPTGGGKTRTALSAVLELCHAEPEASVIWLAPTRELLGQAATTAEMLWHQDGSAPDLTLSRCDVLREFPSPGPNTAAIYFATPQMMVSRARSRGELPASRLVIFDEAHHVAAPTFREAIEKLANAGASIVGLSATPGRAREDETETLVQLFGGRLLSSGKLKPNALKALQRKGVLARLTFREIPALKSSRLAGDDVHRFERLVALAKHRARKGRVLMFVPSVRYGHALAAVLHHVGVRAAVVSAYTDDGRRESILQEFGRGDLKVVINKTLLATGYDCPAINDVVLGVTVNSPILFEQIVGRAARGPSVGGKAKGTIWQFTDHLELHGRPASYHRYEDFDWQ